MNQLQHYLFQMLYSSTPRIDPDSSTMILMRRMCDQIEQQFSVMLNNLQAKENDHINLKMLQKYMISIGQTIIRLISLKIPQFTAIQDKCKSLVLQMNEALEIQKQKYKDLFLKYQQKILENDRYKMEVVQLLQLHETTLKQKTQQKDKSRDLLSAENKQKTKIKQQQLLKYEKYAQTEQKQYKIIESNDYRAIERELEQKKQERDLYHNQLTKYNQIIQQMKQNQVAANQRIQQLLQQIRKYDILLQQHIQTQNLLKNQIQKLVLDLEQQKFNNQQIIDKHKLQIMKTKQENTIDRQKFEKMLADSNDKIKNYQHLQDELRNLIKQLNVNLQHKQQNIRLSQQKLLQNCNAIDQLNSTIKQLHTQLLGKQSIIGELQTKADKIGDITKWQQRLQAKYSKKIDLIVKHNKELQQKLKHSKQENQRLYEAMDQYAGKQLKLSNKLSDTQSKLKKNQSDLQKWMKSRKTIIEQVSKIKKQLVNLKKILISETTQSVMSIIRFYQQNIISLNNQCQSKWAKKIKQVQENQKEEQHKMMQKLKNMQKQYKMLQQKCIQSEMNSGKIANAILQSKNQVFMQLARKDEIILALQKQLAKQKQFNESSTKKISDVVKKYQNYQIQTKKIQNSDTYVEKDSEYLEYERQLIEQKSRYIGLQCEYQSLIKH